MALSQLMLVQNSNLSFGQRWWKQLYAT